ncbi:hypothetical protein, partial [Vibrio cholerae]|uniref:hypothetical protein n=1 Tax=Vibrio cholerae TaxID=666 RepID=UPI001E406DA6
AVSRAKLQARSSAKKIETISMNHTFEYIFPGVVLNSKLLVIFPFTSSKDTFAPCNFAACSTIEKI